MNMLQTPYQNYLYVIGKIRDIYKLDLFVEHQNIHVFSQGKLPLFKLFFGVFDHAEEHSIVVSFHIDLYHPQVIQWFLNIQNIFPLIQLHDSYIEDSSGVTYLGGDAENIKYIYLSQEILNQYLSELDSRDQIEDFVKAKIVAVPEIPKQKSFDSQKEQSKAIIEFQSMKKPSGTEDIH